jgi:hypothetical protein
MGRAVAVLAAAIAAGALWLLADGGAVSQPVAFPHKAHLELKDRKLECRSCHEGVETRLAAGRPATRKCLSCHSGETRSAEERALQTLGEQGEIPWRRVWRLPPDVFFSHRDHVAAARIECRACHGDMAGLTRPPERPLRTVSMEQCIDCHARWQWPQGAPEAVAARRPATDCAACHR